jgi:16S rRNA (guanine966-N2)-methyltransferase
MAPSITGGKFKGRKILRPSGLKIRPTSGKVREALFSILGSRILEANFLDLFAGTGLVGLEAESRGAGAVVLVEMDPKALSLLKKNCQSLDTCTVKLRHRDAFSFLKSEARKGNNYDIVFADPPFFQDFNPLFALMQPVITKNGCSIIQFPSKATPAWLSSAHTVKKYGESSLAFFYN